MSLRCYVALILLGTSNLSVQAQDYGAPLPPPLPGFGYGGRFESVSGPVFPPQASFGIKPGVTFLPEAGDVLVSEGALGDPRDSIPPSVSTSVVFDARFDQAAFFPEPRFGGPEGCLHGDGLVIYEGMLLRVRSDGQYEVGFTATTPATAVTVRLQLEVTTPTQISFTLTLPPIVVDPRTSFRGNAPVESFQVRHVGYSHLLARHFRELSECQVRRHGTARFGSWPQGINRFGVLTMPMLSSSETMSTD